MPTDCPEITITFERIQILLANHVSYRQTWDFKASDWIEINSSLQQLILEWYEVGIQDYQSG